MVLPISLSLLSGIVGLLPVIVSTLVVGVVAAIAGYAWRVRRHGGTVRRDLRWRRNRARASVDSADKRRAAAPAAGGITSLATFPAWILTLVATRSPGARGVQLPPAADARWQLWCTAIAVAASVVALDYWFGPGSCRRALADRFTAVAVAVTVAMVTLPPLLVFWRVESRPAWLCLLAAQVLWTLGGGILGALVSAVRRGRLRLSTPRRPAAGWLAEHGIDTDRDLVLVSPGSRRTQVINEITILTGMGPRAAADAVDGAPALILRQVTGERADRAGMRLESLGATVTVNGAPPGVELAVPPRLATVAPPPRGSRATPGRPRPG